MLDVKSRLDMGEAKTSVSDPALTKNIHSMKEMVAFLSTSRDGGVAAATAKTA